jgi:hypothetical protein
MKQKTKTPGIVIMAILTAITVIFGVIFEVIRTFTSQPSYAVEEKVIKALNPSLDKQALTKLQKTIYLSESEIGEGTIETKLETTEEPQASPEAEESTESAETETIETNE